MRCFYSKNASCNQDGTDATNQFTQPSSLLLKTRGFRESYAGYPKRKLPVKLAILGDIHGNYLALQSVLDAARSRDSEQLLITGDLVGYYFWPAEVLGLLAKWDASIVSGNHENMLSESRKNKKRIKQVDIKYGTGLRVAIEQLDTQKLDELCSLPHPLKLDIDGCKLLLCHGAPWDVDQYIYSDSPSSLLHRCVEQDYDVVILGHTHYPMYKKIGRTQLVNPGSVGQTRNYKPGAYWALFDTESRDVNYYCETYDVHSVISEARQRHPEIGYLAEVLMRR